MTGLVLRPQVGLWAQEGGRRGTFINTCSGLSKCSEANREGFLSTWSRKTTKGCYWDRAGEVTGVSVSHRTRSLLGDKSPGKEKKGGLQGEFRERVKDIF